MSDLIHIISYIKYLYEQIEQLEKNGKKISIEYNELIKKLIKAKETEKSLLNLNSNQFKEMKTKLQEMYPFLKNGISISLKLKDEYLIAIRLMNEILAIEATILNEKDYELGLSEYLTIDELSLALSFDSTSQLKFHIGFLVPDIEQELLNNNFEIPKLPMVYNEAIKDIYGISDEYHEKYKDKILLYRFKTLLENITLVSDEEIRKNIEYYTLLKYILMSIRSLCSTNLILVLDDLVNNYLENCKEEAKKILTEIIASNKRERYLKVTF